MNTITRICPNCGVVWENEDTNICESCGFEVVVTDADKEKILRNMTNLLDEYDYEYTTSALKKIIDEWERQKAPLIRLFKNHPNYVEGEFLIAFDENYDRGIDVVGIEKFSNWIGREINLLTTFLPQDIRDRMKVEGGMFLPPKIYDLLIYKLDDMPTILNEEWANCVNRALPNIKAVSGQKTSRVVNKICKHLGYDKHEEYNRKFAAYSDAINPLSIVRHTVISLNPIDYLTMSFGNSWASCHTIDKLNRRNCDNSYQGCNSSGTMSYMLDGTSAVYYTVSKDYEGKEYYFQDKITRQMFFYGEDKLIQGRLYPQGEDGATDKYTQVRNIVQKVYADILGIPNLWKLTKGTSEASKYIYSHGTHYRDYNHFSSCTLSIIQDSENGNSIDVGADPICIECGCRHQIEENINCCSGGYRCEDCGAVIRYEDDVHWVNGYPYCDNCVEYCEHCDEYHRGESTEVIHHGWGYARRINVCEVCREDYYAYCEECGDWTDRYTYDDEMDEYYCDDCWSNTHCTCEICGDEHHESLMEQVDGMMVCGNCYENYKASREPDGITENNESEEVA